MDHSHNPEFTSLESYQAYAHFDGLFDFTEAIFRGLAEELLGKAAMDALESRHGAARLCFSAPFARVSYDGVLRHHLGHALMDTVAKNAAEAVPGLLEACRRFGLRTQGPHTAAVLLDRLGGHLVEDPLVQPTFVVDHPLVLSPLAQANPHKVRGAGPGGEGMG